MYANFRLRTLEAVGPVGRLAPGMGYGDDLDFVHEFAVDDGKRISVEYQALGAVDVRRIEPWLPLHTVKGGEKFPVKPVGGSKALARVPCMGGFHLPPGRRMKLQQLQARRRALA